MSTRYDTFYRSMPPPNGNGMQSGANGTQLRAQPFPTAASRQPSVLEAHHPEIVQAITLLWGYPEMNTYFEKLWLDDGNGAPIAPEAMSELMLLASVHQWLSPQRSTRTLASLYDASAAPERRKDVWDDVPRRR